MSDPKLPRSLSLPSGARAVLDAHAAAARAPALRTSPPLVAALELLAAEGVARIDGAPLALEALPLRDFHVLRAVLARSGLIAEQEREARCDNCGAVLRARPSSGLEVGPFVHAELDDPELDAAFDFGMDHPIPAIRVPGGVARSLRLAPRAAADLGPLAAARPGELRLRSQVVKALGIVRLGRERRPGYVARSLARASDDAWAAIGELYDRAHYVPRLVSVLRCGCGARVDWAAPDGHELDAVAPLSDDAGGEEASVISLEAFERRAAAHAERSFARLGLAPIAVVVDPGVPAVDDAGEPLLGSYTPSSTDASGILPQPAEIRLYHRSFCNEARLDPTFDVDEQIRETIDHELEHHEHALAGEDPLDDEEQAEIARELVRRVGRKELAVRGVGQLGRELVQFVRVVWPVLLVVAVASLLPLCGARG